MSEEDNKGPSGEDPNVKPRVDPATGLALPVGIAGFTLPDNFNTSRQGTWPEGLTREHVNRWMFPQAREENPGQDVVDQLSGKEQPVNDGPVNPDGAGPMTSQIPQTFLPPLPKVDGIPTHPVMVSMSEKLDVLLSRVGGNTKDYAVELEALAELAYVTYCKAVGGKSVTGELLPTWSGNPKDHVKDAWRAAVRAVLEA